MSDRAEVREWIKNYYTTVPRLMTERDEARARLAAVKALCERWAENNGDVVSITAVLSEVENA